MSTVKLRSSDDEIFNVDIEVAKCSGTIRIMLENWCTDKTEKAIIPLLNVSARILRKVFQWSAYHKDDPEPIEADDENTVIRTDDISTWDAEFLKMEQETLMELIMAANYLDVKGLLEVACKSVANMIKGKTPEEIRKTFNIKNDFTGAEEQQLKEENKWCEEA